jgi:outer membrane protein TolC
MTSLVPAALALALSVAQAPDPGEPPRQLAPARPAPDPVVATTLSLGDALRLTAERNLDLKAAEARLKQAEQGYSKALSGYLPQLTAGGTYTRNGSAVEIPFPSGQDAGGNLTFTTVNIVPLNQVQGTIDASQMLFSPALWFGIKAASRGGDAARASTEAARRSILFGTAQAFYAVASLRRTLEVSERLLEIAQRQEKDARVRFQAGAIAKVGQLRAEIDRARAEQDVLRARNGYQSARLGLATLLDRPADFEVADPPEPTFPANVTELEAAALRDRPDLLAARKNLESAVAARRAQQSRYFPNLAAFGHYQNANVPGLTGAELWSVGLSLQWKLIDGGLREADIREASARVAEAEVTVASAEARARLEVQQTALDLESARANAVKAKEQRDLAAENQRLVDVSFRAGAATAVEQADATTALRNAEIAQLTEALNAQLAAVRVLQAAGASIR